MTSSPRARPGNSAQVGSVLVINGVVQGLAHLSMMAMGSTVSFIISVIHSILMMCIDTAGSEVIKFGVESKYSCPGTSTSVFKESISSALLDMQALCSQVSHAYL